MTEDELQADLSGRLLVEGHHVDFKKVIAAGDKANLGLATLCRTCGNPQLAADGRS